MDIIFYISYIDKPELYNNTFNLLLDNFNNLYFNHYEIINNGVYETTEFLLRLSNDDNIIDGLLMYLNEHKIFYNIKE